MIMMMMMIIHVLVKLCNDQTHLIFWCSTTSKSLVDVFGSFNS